MRLQDMAAEIDAEKERREAEIESLRQEVDALQPGDTKDAKQRDLQEAVISYQSWARFTADEADIEQALAWQDLYRSIKQAAAALAQAEGYDLVIVDDSLGELSVNPNAQVSRSAQIQQQMRSRRLLYASETVDITDELILRMNNAF
jgi:Skp family chaperone for outer membrane proteins